jgi:outer membrane protein assembly complex protein YaeT
MWRYRALTAAVAAGLVAVAASARSAYADVSDYVGRNVASVRLEAEGRTLSDGRLLELVQTRAGRPLSMLEVRETVAHLFGLGRFENIRVHADAAGGSVALRYELAPLHPIGDIVFVSLPSDVSDDDVRRAVDERFGGAPDSRRLSDAVGVVENMLRDRGYLRPSVESRLDVQHDSEQATLTFLIRPGSRTRVASVDLVGDAGMPAAQLLKRLDLAPGSSYEPEALNARIQRYVDERRSHGFYGTTVRLTTTLLDEDRAANVLLTITQGPRVRVLFDGDPLPADRLDDLVPVAREASASEDLLEDSAGRIEDYLRAQGYAAAVARYVRAEVNGELLITFSVNRGPRYRVAEYEVAGNSFIPLADFARGLSVRVGQPYSAASLDADVAAIQDLYRRAGFSAVKVDSGVNPQPAAAPASEVAVVVRVVVTENARTLVGSVRVRGNDSVPEAALIADLGLRPGQPFYLAQMALDRDAIALKYANLGYRTATVEGNPGLSGDSSRADVLFTVREGSPILVDHILVVGNSRTRTETIERELLLKPGQPLGLADVTESQRRLAALGLFRRTRITELRHGQETTRDVLVTVEEAPVTTIGFGGGLEVTSRLDESRGGVANDELELAPRAFFEIGRRNLFGKNRSISLFTRMSLRQGYFNEFRVLGTFREPRVVGTAADAFLTAAVEQQVRTSFNFARRAFSAEVGRQVTRALSISGNYQIQRTELFDEQLAPEDRLLIDRVFPQLVLSSFSISGIRTTRDDPVDPSTGHYFSANGQIAARSIGSEVGLVKTFLTGQWFRTLPAPGQIVLATSGRLGMAAGFPREVLDADSDAEGGPVRVVRELPASERFFAGGDTTVRGFALDQLGTPATIDEDGFPIGGNALVIFNAELRVPVRGGLGVVAFFDSGNVFARTSDVDLAALRSAIGFGVRYRSPVGPIRVDIGYKLNRRNIALGRREGLSALHISLGQAF